MHLIEWIVAAKQERYNMIMSDTEPTSRERYREIKRLWDEAAKNDWRGPVKIMPGWQESEAAALARERAKYPGRTENGPKAPSKSRYRIFDYTTDPPTVCEPVES